MAYYSNKNHGVKYSSKVMTGGWRLGLWVGLAFIAGYGLSFFYSPVLLKAFFSSKPQVLQPILKPMNTENTVVLPKPKFVFYTLLTQEKASLTPAVVPTATPTATPTNAPIDALESKAVIALDALEPKAVIAPTPKPQLGPNHTYLLQLASFQRQEDAEQMKASLIMRGFDAQIKTVSQLGATWYRVVMGPFHSRQLAEKTQADMIKNQRLSGIVRRADV